MNIVFSTSVLQKCANDRRYAIKKLGNEQAEKFFRRMQFLKTAITFEDLRYVPGNFHELNYKRKGQWAFDLDQPYRLILTPQTKPIAVDKDGKFLWKAINDVIIVEIINYHKER